uniref:Uncharacterized protein n=1 Tax=Opuntia streptacantha TaxID=393608 RepID=A0A7C9EDA2_OPUST
MKLGVKSGTLISIIFMLLSASTLERTNQPIFLIPLRFLTLVLRATLILISIPKRCKKLSMQNPQSGQPAVECLVGRIAHRLFYQLYKSSWKVKSVCGFTVEMWMDAFQ